MMSSPELDAAAGLEALGLELPDGLTLQWLGVSGFLLIYQGQALIIDPYLSRVPLRTMLLRRNALPDSEAIAEFAALPEGVTLTGVLVGHTHFDHAVDAPAIAAEHGVQAYGSSSLAHLMRLHGVGHLATEVVTGRPYELGPFVVTFTPSKHAKLLLGRRVPMDGELTCDHVGGLIPTAYKCGAVYGIRIEVAGMSFYHQGSADLDDAALGDAPVDVFLAGVAGRSFTPRYWQRILPKLDPAVVVPTHYDNFFTPLGSERDLVRGVKLAEVPAEIAAVSADARVAGVPRVDTR